MANKTGVTLYYAEWCGHCQRFKPEWEKLKTMLKAKNIPVAEYEADNKGGKNPGKIPQDIRGDPTIVVNGEVYNGERTAQAIMRKVIGNNQVSNSGGYQQCGGGKKKKFMSYEEEEEYYKLKYYKYKAKYIESKKI